MSTALFTLLLFLFVKHFLVDFPLQNEWNTKNKGTYGHMGGISHSFGHFAFTGSVLAVISVVMKMNWPGDTIFCLALFDGVVHYHIDWAKSKINKHFGWRPETDEHFWTLTGLDQLLHAVTYLVIAAYLFM